MVPLGAAEVTLLSWWRSRSSASRFDYFTRSSFYLTLVALPILPMTSLANDDSVSRTAAVATIVAIVVHAACCMWLVHQGIEHYLGKAPFPRLALTVAAVVTAVVVAGGMAVLPGAPPGGRDGPVDAVTLFVPVLFVTAVSCTLRPRVTAAVVAATGVFLVLTVPLGAAVPMTIALVFFTAVYRTSVWMIGTMWELDRSREVRASLAVAEERLRFARDLHDVVGRNLSVVALKAELAAKLAQRGRDEAVAEMLEVRRIAQESLDELRAVVSGYRTADLTVELAGARSLLTSAGIDCRVIGEPSLPDEAAGALGWAVREGVTNVLRHSEARTCTIALRGTTLTMSNDGATATTIRFGSGLTGLRERVATLGGSVTATPEPPHRFVLTVELP
ncbi:sensor histidine kinase [Lentzea sp. NPDC042327]|uniref:sensor histidine kinase n=1 Tax=Lentzea sp. NPDC042327 TaxID=3154801 RepID=UPI0033FAFCCD